MLTPIAKYSTSTTRVDVMVKMIISADVISKRIDTNADIVSAWFLWRGVLNSSTISLKCHRGCPVGRGCYTKKVGGRYLPSQQEGMKAVVTEAVQACFLLVFFNIRWNP